MRRSTAGSTIRRRREHAAGFVLLALKGFLLLGDGDVRGARAAFETSAAESLERGLLVVAALSLSGLTRAEYLAGAWDSAVVASERAIALAVESEDRWVIALCALVGQLRAVGSRRLAGRRGPRARDPGAVAHLRASYRCRGDRDRRRSPPPATGRPTCSGRFSRSIDSSGATEWTTRRSCPGSTSRRMRSSTPASWTQPRSSSLPASARATARENPLLAGTARPRAREARVRAPRRRTRAAPRCGRRRRTSRRSTCRTSRRSSSSRTVRCYGRSGERRAAAAMLLAAHGRFSELGAQPALQTLRDRARRVRPRAGGAQDARLHGPDASGARRGTARGLGDDEPRGRRAAHGEHQDRRVPSQPRVHQARRPDSVRAPRASARERTRAVTTARR